jgi:uncharacterized protein DUF1761
MAVLTQRKAGGVLVAAVAALVASALYYMALGAVYEQLRGGVSATPELWTMIVQLGRNIVVAGVLATLLHMVRATTRRDTLRVGMLVWLGFQAMAVLGSVIHESYPFGLYLLHVGDALLATLVMTLVLGRRPA